MGVEEKRRFTRVEFHAPARLLGADGTALEVEVLDLSMRGALVQLAETATIPELLRDGESSWTLELPLSEQDIIQMEVTPAHWYKQEVGVKCRRIDLESMVHLRSLLEANLGDTELVNRELMHLVDEGS